MTQKEISSLEENTSYFWMVRYRDRNLSCSEWSNSLSFNTTNSALSENLLLNSGAENGTENWNETSGSFESILSGECAGNDAHSGSYLFAVGGVCDPHAYGEGYQEVSIAAFAADIDNNSAYVKFGGYLSDYSGSDIPAFKLAFYDNSGGLLSETNTYEHQGSSWTLIQDLQAIPVGARTIRMVLTGTRNAGTDNDSYFDDLFIKVQTTIDDCESLEVGLKIPNGLTPIKVFPNPSSGTISLEVAASLGAQAFTISDVNGETSFEGILKEGLQSLDLKHLKPGTYFLNARPRMQTKFILN